MTSYTNQLTNVWTYAYDAAGWKTNEAGVGVYTNSFTYKPAGDLLTLTDGKNHVTTWNYDAYGRVTNKLDQASVEILRYKYDANNRLTNRWSNSKGDTAYSYEKGVGQWYWHISGRAEDAAWLANANYAPSVLANCVSSIPAFYHVRNRGDRRTSETETAQW